MIVCSCNRLSAADIKRAAQTHRLAKDGATATTASVFRRLGKQPQCKGCLPLIAKLIHITNIE